jgi:hypothetical protein
MVGAGARLFRMSHGKRARQQDPTTDLNRPFFSLLSNRAVSRFTPNPPCQPDRYLQAVSWVGRLAVPARHAVFDAALRDLFHPTAAFGRCPTRGSVTRAPATALAPAVRAPDPFLPLLERVLVERCVHKSAHVRGLGTRVPGCL